MSSRKRLPLPVVLILTVVLVPLGVLGLGAATFYVYVRVQTGKDYHAVVVGQYHPPVLPPPVPQLPPPRLLKGHTGAVLSVGFSSDGATLASGGADHTVRLWDVKTGQMLKTLEGQAGAVRAVAFSPDDRRLVSAGDDGIACVWNLKDGAIDARLEGHEGPIRTTAFMGKGRVLTAGADSTLRIWDVEGERAAAVLEVQEDSILDFGMTADQKMAVLCDAQGKFEVWDLNAGRSVWSFQQTFAQDEEAIAAASHVQPVQSMAIAPDGSVVYVVDGRGKLGVWDLKARQPRPAWEPEADRVQGVSVSADSQHVLLWGSSAIQSFGAGGATHPEYAAELPAPNIKAANAEEALSNITTLMGAPAIRCAAFSSDGKMIAVGCGPIFPFGAAPKTSDNSIRLFDVKPKPAESGSNP